MKFCKKRKIEYKASDGTATSAHYITEKDITEFHGTSFAVQWKVFAQKINKTTYNGEEGYYFTDYQHFARATNSYLNDFD